MRSPRKQQHTAKRIFERLVSKCSFIAAESKVRQLDHEMKEKQQEAFVPLEFPPGEVNV